MYSVVVLMALSGGAEVPAVDFYSDGGTYASYANSGTSTRKRGGGGGGGFLGKKNKGCCGCEGGGGGGFLGKYKKKKNKGGCQGYTAGCYGCQGYTAGCCGCQGHTAGCYGHTHGCYGGHGHGHKHDHKHDHGKTEGKEVKPVKDKGKEKTKGNGNVSAPARIIVTLPANAQLFVDGTATTSTNSRRVFQTPTLPAGSTYGYSLRAEVVANGQTIAQTKRVVFVAGQTTSVNFEFSTGGVAANR